MLNYLMSSHIAFIAKTIFPPSLNRNFLIVPLNNEMETEENNSQKKLRLITIHNYYAN